MDLLTSTAVTPKLPTVVCGCSQHDDDRQTAALLDTGVGELFAGLVSPRWVERVGVGVSPNRRYSLDRQHTDPAALRRVADLARHRGARLAVTFNEHLYGPEARALLPDLVGAALDAGASALILADLTLLDDLRRQLSASINRGIELIASTEAGCFNAPTAAQWVARGARRVIFPRELRQDEMAAIVRGVGELAGDAAVSWEAFVAREFCVNSSAVCYAAHGYGQPAHFCMAHGDRSLVDLETAQRLAIPSPYASRLHEPGFAQALGDLHRCGFCAIGRLLGLGVRYLKVPGRSSSALAAVGRLRRLLDGGDLSPAACRAVVASPAFCDSGVGCNYDPHASDVASDVASGVVAGVVAAPISVAASALAAASAPASAPAQALYLTLDARWPGGLLEGLSARGLAIFRDLAARGDGPASSGLPTALERAVARRGLDALEAAALDVTSPPRHLYLAQELCANRLAPPPAWLHATARARDAGVRVSWVLPVAYQIISGQVLDLLRAAAASSASSQPVGVVVNDLGTLQAAAALGLRPETGRIFNRMKRGQHAPAPGEPGDARDPVAAARRRETGYPVLRDDGWRALVADHGVERVGFDVLPTPLSAPLTDLPASALYFPWAYMAQSRTCATAVTVDGAPSSLPTAACSRGCHRVMGDVSYPQPARAVGQRGTGTFMDTSTDFAAFLASMEPLPARLVFEPFLPY